ncbi:hypothetical protein CCP4SC76_7230009 [Gammaproteobacteria bacterium]
MIRNTINLLSSSISQIVKGAVHSFIFAAILGFLIFSMFPQNIVLEASNSSITLTLASPQYSSCGDISINGYVSTNSGSISRLSWDWGDGSTSESWFPANHHYSLNGNYSVSVTAYSSSGQSENKTSAVSISDSEDLACRYTFQLHPQVVVLQGGQTKEYLRVELLDENGALIDPSSRSLSFTSTNPSLVQVDAYGTITGTGFGDAEIISTVNGLPHQAKTKVILGDIRLEPPILLLSLSDNQIGKLTLVATNADGSDFSTTNSIISYKGGNNIASVDNSGTVTALSVPKNFSDSPYISVILGNRNADNLSFIRVTNTSLGLKLNQYTGKSTAIYATNVGSYPFDRLINDLQATTVTDAIYSLEKWLVGTTPSSGGLQYLILDPGFSSNGDGTIPCGLSGNPVRLGTPVDNISNSCFGGTDFLHWGIIAHEMGHNFPSQSFQAVIAGLPNRSTYNEAIASMIGAYALDIIVKSPGQYKITTSTEENLSRQIHLSPAFMRNYFFKELVSYETSPDYLTKFNANILDAILMRLHDEYGNAFFYRFLSSFLPIDKPLNINFENESQILAFWVAACSAAANNDLRVRFRDKWGFHFDEAFYEQIYPKVQKLVTQRDPVVRAGADRAISLGQSVTLDGLAFSWENDHSIKWEFISKPVASAASLSDPSSLHPVFMPDVAGQYVLRITASNNITTTTDDVVVSYATDPTKPLLSVSLIGNGQGVVTSNPTGINCGSTCYANFNSGTSVTLTASGTGFTGWSGDCSGSSSACTITMNAAKNVTAKFGGSLTCSADSQSTVQKAYRGYYNRCADQEGMSYWCGKLEKSGGDLSAIIASFGTSKEYTDKFSSLSDTQVLDNLYLNMFDRHGESGGMTYWQNQLDTLRNSCGARECALAQIALQILYGASGGDVTTLNGKIAACPQY